MSNFQILFLIKLYMNIIGMFSICLFSYKNNKLFKTNVNALIMSCSVFFVINKINKFLWNFLKICTIYKRVKIRINLKMISYTYIPQATHNTPFSPDINKHSIFFQHTQLHHITSSLFHKPSNIPKSIQKPNIAKTQDSLSFTLR